MKVKVEKKQAKVKIGDLFFKLGIDPYPNNNYPVEFDLKVKTPYGYYPIDALFTTERQKQVTSYFSNGRTLTTSSHHLLKDSKGEWVKVKDLNVGDSVETEIGYSTIKKQIKKEKEKVLYDMTVRDVRCYYGNGILSHNSWAMVSAAAHAAKMGYNVNYYTLELGEDYVGKRFDCYFTGIGIDEINDHRKEVEKVLDTLKGNLIVKEYPPKSASISTIKAHIQKCIDMDLKPDIIIIDYIDYLRAPSKKFTERKDEIDDVFIAAKGLAKQYQIPVLTPSQVNRMGAKDSVIEGDKAAGSYDKMMVADICLSLSRQKEDKVLGTGRFHFMKNRYGQDGMTYNILMDTNTGRIEVNDEYEGDLLEDSQLTPTAKQITRKFFELDK